MYTGNYRQNDEVRAAKTFLTNISYRRYERYYYNDGSPRFSIIQIDAIHTLDVIERLIERIENLELQVQSQDEKNKPICKSKLPFFMKKKTLANGTIVNTVAWWAKPFLMLSKA